MNNQLTSSADHSSSPTPPGRKRSRWLRRLSIAAVLLVLVVALLPTLLSTGPCMRFILGMVNSRIQGTLRLDELRIGWFSGPQVNHLALLDPQGTAVLKVRQVDAPDLSLWSAMWGGRQFGRIRILQPIATVQRDGVDQPTNLQLALASTQPQPAQGQGGKNEEAKPASGGWSDYRLTVEITEAELSYTGADQKPVIALIPSAKLDMSDPQHLLLEMEAQVKQAGRSGSLNVNGHVYDLFDAGGTLQATKARLDVSGKLIDVPVAMLEALSAQGHSLGAQLGEKINGQVEVKGAVSNLTAKVNLQADRGSRVDADVVVANLLTEDRRLNTDGMSVDADVKLNQLPLTVIEQFSNAAEGISEVIGPTLNATLTAKLSPTGQGKSVTGLVKLTAQAENLNALVNARMLEDGVFMQPDGMPSFVELTVSPKGFDWLLERFGEEADREQPPAMQLVQPAKLRLDVEEAQIALLPQEKGKKSEGWPMDPSRTSLVATLGADTAALQVQRNDATIKVKQVRLHLKGKDLRQPLQVRAQAQLEHQTRDAAGQIGELVSETKISHLVGPSGALSTKTAQIQTDTEGKNLPTSLLDAMLGQEGHLLATLGQVTSFSLAALYAPSQPGRFDLTVDSQNANASIKGTIDPDMNLALEQDATASLRLTPEFDKAWLEAVNPVLSDIESSEQPARLTIKKEDFQFSLKNPQLETVSLKGELDLGTVMMRQGEVGRALVLGLRAAGSPIQDRRVFPAKFTPLKFTVSEGVIRSNDLWFDSGDLFLGTQARVRQVAPGRELVADLALAIPGETVRLIPRITKRVAPSALYDLNVTAPLSQVKGELGKKAAELILTRIVPAALAGQQTGGYVDIATGIAGALLDKPGKSTRTDDAWLDHRWPNRPQVQRAASEEPAAAEAPAADGAAPQPEQRDQAKPAEKSPLEIISDILKKEQEEKERKKREEAERKKAAREKQSESSAPTQP